MKLLSKAFFRTLTKAALIFSALILFSGCYSVFTGGTGGQIVDAENTSSINRGIAYVDIYAYTDRATRDSDYKSWKEGTTFSPSNSYYGHTATDTDGKFTISKIVWKENKPDFGKDADYTTIYLLYFHENYGLIKDETVITSDSTSDTVYAELTAIRKTTSLGINIYDVSTSSAITSDILVKVSVPQNTESLPSKAPKTYEQIISNGSGTITISYPRWKNAEDKANKIENTPEVSIAYFQSADEITWKACSNADNAAKDYSFLEDNFEIKKTVQNASYKVSLYGKATKLSFPTVNGTYGDLTSKESDGVVISMKAKDSSGAFTIDCGETTTVAQSIGTSGTQNHGTFSGLGNSFSWTDNSYTQKNTTIEVKFYANGTEVGDVKTLRSDVSSYNFKLNPAQTEQASGN